MSVYIDVWHRTHPLTPDAHRRFLDYYGESVVAPPSDFFEVVAGFRYLDGPTNEDFALYRYESMARIEESMMSFGGDADFIEATERLFAEIEIEETRGIAIHTPYSSDTRIDELIADAPSSQRAYVRSVRTCGGVGREHAFDLLERLKDEIEASGKGRLAASFHYLVGPVMDIVELWMLPAGAPSGSPHEDAGIQELINQLAEIAPERERRRIEPTRFSRLR